MILKTHRWEPDGEKAVVCIHGVAQHGGVFSPLAERLSANGYSVTAVDLRGHGESGRKPPWNVATHVQDLLETLDDIGVERAIWIGHSFGGLLAAAVAAQVPDRVEALALLDPGLEVPPDRALRSAEIERLDWSFATVDGAINALLSNDLVVASPRDVVAAFVKDDVRKGPDGRFRFRFSPSAAVVAWSEAAAAPPPIASVPTLLLNAEVSALRGGAQQRRYSAELGDLLVAVTVPNGHNVLWESPTETYEAVERFLALPACAEVAR